MAKKTLYFQLGQHCVLVIGHTLMCFCCRFRHYSDVSEEGGIPLFWMVVNAFFSLFFDERFLKAMYNYMYDNMFMCIMPQLCTEPSVGRRVYVWQQIATFPVLYLSQSQFCNNLIKYYPIASLKLLTAIPIARKVRAWILGSHFGINFTSLIEWWVRHGKVIYLKCAFR